MFRPSVVLIVVSVCLLLAISSATAQPVGIEPEEISDFQFQSVHIGQAPVAGMVLREKPGHPDRTMTSRASAVLSYVDGNESLSVGTVLIEPPSYLFWNDQLFSIGFRPDCSEAQIRSCFETVVNALDQEYNLTRIGYRHQENIFGSHDRWEFLTDSNTLVFASITISAGTVIQSYVRFTDKYLADQMGNENNPDKYNPFDVWVDRDGDSSYSQHGLQWSIP